jgi:UDP:flavonoid glycosyltransferase YjiC (YdhE family)
VCNGGSPTCQQALVHGVPVVGIPNNLDQYLNMHYIERFGAGKLIRSDRASATTIRQATRRAMDDPPQRERARAAATLAKTTRPEVEFPSAIRVLLDASPQRFAKLGA